MPDESKNKPALINIQGADLKGLSKPLEKLIASVSKGIGELYKPVGIVREAKAHVQAEIILANAEIEKQEITHRAAQRLAFLEIRRQTNIDAITEEATKSLPASVNEKPVSEDWMVHFFQQAQDVSEQEMQRIWAKILAGEVAEPGSFSRRTLEQVKTLDKYEAELFAKACRMLWRDKESGYGFFIQAEGADQFERELEFYIYHFNHLQAIGLISSNEIIFTPEEMPEFSATYFSHTFKLTWPEGKPSTHDDLHIPYILSTTPLTEVGRELSRIITCEPIPNFPETVMESLAKQHEMILSVIPII